MISASSPAAAVFPILGASVLVIGTGLAVGVSTRKRRRLRRNGVSVEEERDGINSDEEAASPNDDVHVTGKHSSTEETPLRLPTVSTATSIFGSNTYIVFVATALVHGTCLILTSVFQRQIATSDTVITGYEVYAATIGDCILGFAVVGGASIILTSIVPAKGKGGTRAHGAFGVIFINSAILYMISTCMLTPLIGLGAEILIVRGFLTALACATTTALIYCTVKWMKLQGEEGVEEEWYWNMHLLAIAELVFGFFFALYFGTVAIDMRA